MPQCSHCFHWFTEFQSLSWHLVFLPDVEVICFSPNASKQKIICMVTSIILLSIWSADSKVFVYLLYTLYLLKQSIPRIQSVTTTPSLTGYKNCESGSNLTALSRLEVLRGNLSQVLVASDILDQPGDCYTPYLGGLAGMARRALLHHL